MATLIEQGTFVCKPDGSALITHVPVAGGEMAAVVHLGANKLGFSGGGQVKLVLETSIDGVNFVEVETLLAYSSTTGYVQVSSTVRLAPILRVAMYAEDANVFGAEHATLWAVVAVKSV